jgi:NB-ARC domain
LKLSEKVHSLEWNPYFISEILTFVSIWILNSLCRSAHQSTEYSLGLNLVDAPDMSADLFVGRETELQEIGKALQPKSKSPDRRMLILGGMGGIGKAQLAVTYAKRHRSSYPSVFWLNANSESTLNSSLRGVANRILPPETVSQLDDDQLRVQISNWLSELDNDRWLLILDNYDDPGQYQIAEYYPSVAHGSVIITTRQPRRVNGKQVKVKSMTKADDSLAILATRSGRPNIKCSEKQPQKLCNYILTCD